MAFSSIQQNHAVVTARDTSLSLLLDIPAEVRLLIFKHLFTARYVNIIDTGPFNQIITAVQDGTCPASLLRVCKLIASEVQPLYPPYLYTTIPMSPRVNGVSTEYTSRIRIITIGPDQFGETVASVWEDLPSLEKIFVTDCQLYGTTPTLLPTGSPIEPESNEELLVKYFSDPSILYPQLHGVWGGIRWAPESAASDADHVEVIPRIRGAGIGLWYSVRCIPNEEAIAGYPAISQRLPVFVILFDSDGIAEGYRIDEWVDRSNPEPADLNPWIFESSKTFLRFMTTEEQ